MEHTGRGCQTRGASEDTRTDVATTQLESSLKVRPHLNSLSSLSPLHHLLPPPPPPQDEQQQSERLRALLSEREKECAVLEQQLKQLSKEHLILQKKANPASTKR